MPLGLSSRLVLNQCTQLNVACSTACRFRHGFSRQSSARTHRPRRQLRRILSPGCDVGEIGHPDLIRPVSLEPTLHGIEWPWSLFGRDGCPLAATRLTPRSPARRALKGATRHTQSRSVPAVRPILVDTKTTAGQVGSLSLACTMSGRTARSLPSGENLFPLPTTVSSHAFRSPVNAGRFTL